MHEESGDFLASELRARAVAIPALCTHCFAMAIVDLKHHAWIDAFRCSARS